MILAYKMVSFKMHILSVRTTVQIYVPTIGQEKLDF